jgi:hypothetical protein
MKAILFPADQPGALAMQGKLDVAYGCPIDGVDIGDGVHAPKAQSQTIHYGSVLKHPTLSTWAAVCDGFDASKLSGADKTAVASAIDLTADWFA